MNNWIIWTSRSMDDSFKTREAYTRLTLEKIEGAIQNGQSSHWQQWAHKTQDEDKQKTQKQNRRLKRWTYDEQTPPKKPGMNPSARES
jgi:hypothetical protein